MKRIFVKLFRRKVPKKIDNEYHTILMKYCTYYFILDHNLQEKFRLRLYQLLGVLTFHSVRFSNITLEMKVVISSATIMITMQLDNYIPSLYTDIIILPRRYMYPGFDEPFLGHTDRRNNTIFFSWQDVKEGFNMPNDAVNVALHETAHLLEAENFFADLNTDFFDKIDWANWADVAYPKMQEIRDGENLFLKKYGGKNMSEMFAVCVETFFEQPISFEKNMPQTYNAMANLLNQDMASMLKTHNEKHQSII